MSGADPEPDPKTFTAARVIQRSKVGYLVSIRPKFVNISGSRPSIFSSSDIRYPAGYLPRYPYTCLDSLQGSIKQVDICFISSVIKDRTQALFTNFCVVWLNCPPPSPNMIRVGFFCGYGSLDDSTPRSHSGALQRHPQRQRRPSG